MIFVQGFSLLYATWIFYLAVMNLKRAKDAGKLTWPAKVMGYPVLFVGLALDCLLNLTVCTFLFLELPREGLVTARLKRLEAGGGWRAVLATWFAVSLLNTFDPSGKHV
jgi:hypothetical protein